jgi:tRNA (guanine37-N1)-methyltransferase
MIKLKQALKEKLSKSELELLPSSFDIVGDILIFSDFPKELDKKQKIIGEELMRILNNIHVVTKKVSKYSGRFRTPKLRIIAGDRRKETIHKENNVQLKLHAENVYFSPRLSNERKRIAQLVKPNERILVMFSGCAPYPCVLV